MSIYTRQDSRGDVVMTDHILLIHLIDLQQQQVIEQNKTWQREKRLGTKLNDQFQAMKSMRQPTGQTDTVEFNEYFLQRTLSKTHLQTPRKAVGNH